LKEKRKHKKEEKKMRMDAPFNTPKNKIKKKEMMVTGLLIPLRNSCKASIYKV